MPATSLLIFVIETFAVSISIAWGTLKRPALGLSICIALLPLFSLTRKLFAYSSFMLFPTLESLSVFFLWICTLLYSVKHRQTPSPNTHWGSDIFAIVLFLGFALVSCFMSPDVFFSLKFLFTGGIIPVIVYGLIQRWARDDHDTKLFVIAVLGVGLQTILYSIYQLQAYPDIFNTNLEVLGTVYLESPVTGLFYVPFVTASILLSAIPLSAWYRRFGIFLNNLAWLILTVGAVFIAILTFSRGVWIAYSGVIVAMVPLTFSKIRFRDVGFLIVLVFVLYIIYTSEWAQHIFDFRINSIDSEQSTSIRSINYALVFRSIPKYFFIGVGLGQYPEIYRDFPLDPASIYHHLWFAHSLILTLIPEIGFLGTLGFVFLFINGMRKGVAAALSNWGDPRNKLIYALVISLVFSLVIDSFSGNHLVAYLYFLDLDHTYFMAPEMILLFAQLGMIKALSNRIELVPTRPIRS